MTVCCRSLPSRHPPDQSELALSLSLSVCVCVCVCVCIVTGRVICCHCCRLAGSYLCHVISDDALKRELFASERIQLRVVNVWLRCVLAPPTTGSRQLEELTG